jgi:Glycosyl hydrolase catalytic core
MGTIRTTLAALLVALAATAVLLVAVAVPAGATVPQNGKGLGISDPDPIPSNSLRERFAALRPKVFRVIVDWNVIDDPGLEAQVATRIARARAAGVDEVAVAFGGPAAYVAPEAWIAKVGAFVDKYSPVVNAWSPVNEPNFNPGGVPNWLATTPRSSRPTAPHGYGVEVLARYSQALNGFLAQRHPDDLLLSPDLHDDYDGDLSDGTPLSTVVTDGRRISTVADYLRHFRTAGGELGAALAWHPYSGVNRRDMTSTEDIAAEVPGLPIWVTEIGAAGQIPGGRFERAGEAYQQETVDWMLGPGLASHPQVERIYYWHMLDHNPVWDTALVRADGSPRPAWYSWCAAAHRGDRSHPDCAAARTVEARSVETFGPGPVWRPPSGLIASGVTAVEPWAGRTVLLARGPDSALWERRLGGREWAPWRSLGGVIESDPVANSSGDGRISVSARGADGAAWEIDFDGVEWTEWTRAP